MTTSPQTDETRDARPPRASARTCAGCQGSLALGEPSSPDLHVRVVIDPTAAAGAGAEARAEVAVDFAGGSFGRGAHVHLRPACIERACRAGFARAFKRPVSATPAAIARQVVLAAEKRIVGLLLGARRAKLLAFGDEAREAVASGKAELAVLAADAGASATKGALLGAVSEGRAMVLGSKAELGALFGREEVALVAILHGGIAAEVKSARASVDAVRTLAGVAASSPS